jgi:hypothetical protein
MSWSDLQDCAGEYGFEVALQTMGARVGEIVPNTVLAVEKGWQLVGSYKGVAGVWVRAVTEAAREVPLEKVATMLKGSDPFVEPLHGSRERPH